MNNIYIIIYTSLLLCFSSNCISQINKPSPTLGIDFKLNKYRNLKSMQPGIGLTFMNGISPKYSYSIRSSGYYLDSAVKGAKSENKKLLVELYSSLLKKLANPSSRHQPYVLVGLGMAYYDKQYGPFIPGGVGLQSKLSSEAFMNLSMEYRVNIGSQFNNHFNVSLGLGGILNRKKNIHKSNYVANKPIRGIAKQDVLASDRDHDGILDSLDMCPDNAGVLANNGCPVSPNLHFNPAMLLDSLAKHILFESNSSNLKPASYLSLDEVLKILTRYPEIVLTVKGHTDNIGSEEKNMQLSNDRSKAVVNYLVNSGILEFRLKAEGFGESQPIADNQTNDGRRKNRRVELKIR